MALKPTIYKCEIALSDINRAYYGMLNLTIAQHPSETVERMVARMIAFCINASNDLQFGAGLSADKEPDILEYTLDNQMLLWIDVGEPSYERIKKASHRAKTVKVYSFNAKSQEWWRQTRNQYNQLSVAVFQFPWQQIQSLAALMQRTMKLSVTVIDDTALIVTDTCQQEIRWNVLQSYSTD